MGQTVAMAISLRTPNSSRQSAEAPPPHGDMGTVLIQTLFPQPLTGELRMIQMSRTLLCITIVTFLSLPVMAQRSALLPKAANARFIGQANGPNQNATVVQVRFKILKVHEANLDKVQIKLGDYFPMMNVVGDESLSIVRLGNDQNDRVDELVRQLVEKKLVGVIARPQLMTVAGRNAEIQVNPVLPDHDSAGLKLQCLSTVTPDAGKLQLDLTYATSADLPESSVKLAVESNELVAVWHRAQPTALLLVKATTLEGFAPYRPKDAPPFKTVQHKRVVQLRKTTMIEDLLQLQDALGAQEGATVQSIEMDSEQFNIELVLNVGRSLKDISKALSDLKRVKIEAIRVDAVGAGLEVHILGRYVQNPAAPVRQLPVVDRALNQELQALRKAIDELTEKINDQ